MKICVIGAGFIGLPMTCLLAQKHDVVCVDKDTKKLEELKKGNCFVKEPEFLELFDKVYRKINFVYDVKESDFFIICVQTPITKDKKPDLKYVDMAVAEISDKLRKGNVIVIESTIPVGTCDKAAKYIEDNAGLKTNKDFFIAHCPERTLPGNIVNELVYNTRIIGCNSIEGTKTIEDVYRSFCKGEMMKTDARTAEFIKLIENSYRDTNIAFANEIAKLAEKDGINVFEAIEMANKHPRVNIHKPGPGVGGHCIPVDPWFLHSKWPETAKIIENSRKINDSMPHHVIEITKKALKKNGIEMKNSKIAVMGVAYKADVNDARESPAIEIIELLKKENCNISIYDPHVKNFMHEIEDDAEKTLSGADCLLLIAPHSEFKKIDNDLLKTMRNKIIIDTCNFFDKINGFDLHKLGVGK